jgi:hypothetical protein
MEQLHTDAKYAAVKQSWGRSSVRAAYAEIKTANPKARHSTLVRLMAERMLTDDDVLRAAADYIVTNCEEAEAGYVSRRNSTARRPPTPRAVLAEEVRTTVDAIKEQILLLNLEMPNGKRMRYCTGTEMGEFGKAYQRIAKKVGNKLVGSVLNETEVRKLMQ